MTLFSAVAPVLETPLDSYLAEQSAMTAVDRFSRFHEDDAEHEQARYYRNLIPLTKPGSGQQYGFEVDLDACTGCKSCVAACHSLNGLDDDELWRTVTLLRSEPTVTPYQQTVTSACHHCVDPACLKGCPVDAYEKDPITGIVSHLDDQCIGCSYCTLACPYEVPVYNAARGIVRKCDMCTGRLSVGEAPACVQGCPNEAITITVVDIAAAKLASLVPGAVMVNGTPPSNITVPTTVYRTARNRLSDNMSTEHFSMEERPAAQHTPLAVMLVLTQLSVGAFAIDQLLRFLPGHQAVGASRTFDAVLAVAAGLLAMGASVFHLGRPQFFYRAIIGFRHSWLSREVAAFGAFTGLATAYAIAVVLGWPVAKGLPLDLLGAAAAASGLIGVGCSVMIYAVTRRASWRAARLVAKFAGTAAVCGLAAIVWASTVSSFADGSGDLAFTSPRSSWIVALIGLVVAKLGAELSVLRHLPSHRTGSADGARVLRLLVQNLRGVAIARLAAGVLGGVVIPLLLLTFGNGPAGWLRVAVSTLALLAITTGELLERSLFFSTVSRPR